MPDETSPTDDDDKEHIAQLERSLTGPGFLWEWTDCGVKWPEGGRDGERQTMFEESLERWRNMIKVTLFKLPSGGNWQLSLEACVLADFL